MMASQPPPIPRIARAREAAPPKGANHSIEIFILVSLFLLSAQGILNFAFRGTPLVVWKQALLIALCFISPFLLTSLKDYTARIALALSIVLIVSSIFQGVTPLKVSQHILYYGGWVPFYILGQTGNSRTRALEDWSFVFIIVSGIGFFAQLYTPYLDFLKDNAAAIQYQKQFAEAQRLALYFVASTIAMPTLLCFFYFVCTGRNRSSRAIICLPFLAMATLPTGSVGAFVSLVFCFVLAVYSLRIPLGGRFAVFVAAILLSLFLYEFVIDMIDPVTSAQIKRIITNDQYSESNRGRFVLWQQAWDVISSFDIVRHLGGLGLGITVAERAGLSAYAHGESSYFQAYIEGGISGLILRTMPFGIILYYSIIRKNVSLFIVFASSFITCAVAPIFSGFGIECTLGLIAGMARYEKVGE